MPGERSPPPHQGHAALPKGHRCKRWRLEAPSEPVDITPREFELQVRDWLSRSAAGIEGFEASRETFATLEIGDYVAMGGPDEAAEYLRKLIPHWWKKEVQEFPRRLLVPGPFRSRMDRVLKANVDLEGLQVGEKRSALVEEMFLIFREESIPEILGECQALL